MGRQILRACGTEQGSRCEHEDGTHGRVPNQTVCMRTRGSWLRRAVSLEAGPRGAACGPVSCSRFVRSRKYYTMYTAPVSQSVSYLIFHGPAQRSRPRRQAAGAALRGRSSPPPLAIFFPALLSWGSSFLHFFPVPPRVMEPLASRNTLVVRWLPRHIYHRLCSPVTMCCRRRAPSVTPPSIAIL